MAEIFNTPVLFLIFNRLETAERVFSEIRKIRPSCLFLAADGPRPGHDGEAERCQEVRRVILSQIDWDCEVKTLFRDQNLGCKIAVSSAITWFFENVTEGIILEDDCCPNQSFFYFCQALLERYKSEPQVFMISGDNFLPDRWRPKESYYFSQLAHIWGWASWRRAWKFYDAEMSDWPEFLQAGRIKQIWPERRHQNYYLDKFQQTYDGQIDTWDYQWLYAIWKNQGICIMPSVNLVSNIGFGGGTHTANKQDYSANRDRQTLGELIHPAQLTVNSAADFFTNEQINLKNYRLKKFLKKLGLFNFFKALYLHWQK